MTGHGRGSYVQVAVLLSLLGCISYLVAASAAGRKERAVHFVTSCGENVTEAFDEAVEVLHSSWYEESLRQFASITAAHPKCVMAYWGVAMSLWHPLWPAPSMVDIQMARQAISAAHVALAGASISRRERDYLEAIETFYAGPLEFDVRVRAALYETKMNLVYQRYGSTDVEAAVFYGLALNSRLLTLPANASQEALNMRKKAGAILEQVLAMHPDHPGALHYLIHSYDEVSLAPLGLKAAHRYAEVAPVLPHAQHMPSHIFLALGMWDEEMKSNRRAMAAALEQDRVFYRNLTQAGKDPISEEFAHALSFLSFGLTQQAKDGEVKKLLDEMVIDKEGKKYAITDETVANALSSIAIRYSMERNRWEELENFELLPSYYSWGNYTWANLFKQYARTMSFLQRGLVDQAKEQLTTQLKPAWEAWHSSAQYPMEMEDWRSPLNFLLQSCVVWLEFLSASDPYTKVSAIERLKVFAEQESDGADIDRSWLLAWDQVGELYLKVNMYEEALGAFNKSLDIYPNRFRALAGAAKSAFLAAEDATAVGCMKALLQLCYPAGLGLNIPGTTLKEDSSCGKDRMDVYKELKGLYTSSQAAAVLSLG